MESKNFYEACCNKEIYDSYCIVDVYDKYLKENFNDFWTKMQKDIEQDDNCLYYYKETETEVEVYKNDNGVLAFEKNHLKSDYIKTI